MSSKRKSFLLRMDPQLWDDLNGWAADELRSVNGQIEYILRKAVRDRKKLPSDNSVYNSTHSDNNETSR